MCPGEFFTGEFVSEKETKGREGNEPLVCVFVDTRARAKHACVRACVRCVRGVLAAVLRHKRVHAYQFGYILGEYKKKKTKKKKKKKK